mmetsp:Transcript_15315/g.43811  ORF Transcript_15315/g.43811 Transcript_15315/m.43811 type:complete len:228 (-) Transcript_15315:207-890(-)
MTPSAPFGSEELPPGRAAGPPRMLGAAGKLASGEGRPGRIGRASAQLVGADEADLFFVGQRREVQEHGRLELAEGRPRREKRPPSTIYDVLLRPVLGLGAVANQQVPQVGLGADDLTEEPCNPRGAPVLQHILQDVQVGVLDVRHVHREVQVLERVALAPPVFPVRRDHGQDDVVPGVLHAEVVVDVRRKLPVPAAEVHHRPDVLPADELPDKLDPLEAVHRHAAST